MFKSTWIWTKYRDSPRWTKAVGFLAGVTIILVQH